MRLVSTLVTLSLAAMLLFGCGGSSDSTTTRPHMDSGAAHGTEGRAETQASWLANPACKHRPGASRWGCSVGSYRCQAVVTDRGWSVDCAKPGRSVSFTVSPRK